MQKLTFINKFLKLYKSASRRLDIMYEHAKMAILSSCGRQPSVNVETFMTVNFGYKKENFANPKTIAPELRNEAIYMMSKDGVFNVDFKLLSKATNTALKLLGLKRNMFAPTTVEKAAQRLPANTSTGAWWFRAPKSDFFNHAVEICRRVIYDQDVEYITSSTIAVVAWRTQERLGGTKFRQIFVLNYVFNIIEAMFAVPIFQFYERNANYSYSFNSVYLDNKRIWEKLQKSPRSIALDYSKFDLSMSKGIIAWGLMTIKSLFKLTPFMSELFDGIITVHLSCPVFTSLDGKPYVFRKKAGVLSGSVFTNFLDSLLNLIMLCYCFYKHGYDPEKELIKVKGDDVIMSDYQNIQIRAICFEMKRSFGAVISDKSTKVFYPGQKIEYLGYRFDNKSKIAFSDELLDRKIAVSGRFISEQTMSEPFRVISKIVSVLSNVSNGYHIFMTKYRDKFLNYYGVSELPKYYADLAETEIQSYSTTNIKNVMHELKFGWMYR